MKKKMIFAALAAVALISGATGVYLQGENSDEGVEKLTKTTVLHFVMS